MTTPNANGKTIHEAMGRMPATKSAGRMFQNAPASSSHHNPATAVNVTMMYAPRATHDFHCGRSRIFKKRLGWDKSLMSRMVVMSMKIIAVKPVARKVAESKLNRLNIEPRLNSMNNPPAMFLVTRYDGSSQCQLILCCALYAV